MLFRNHLVVTLAAALATNNLVVEADGGLWWTVFGCIFFGSFLPDLDHTNSVIGKRLLFISLPISTLFGHRTILHSIWPIAAMFYYIDHQAETVLFSIAIGFTSHVVADAMTDSGVPIFWPVPWRLKMPITVETGGVLEYLIAYSLLFFSIYEMVNV